MSQGISRVSAWSYSAVRTTAIFTLALACLFTPACSDEPSHESSDEPSPNTVVHTYTLRGKIVSLPDASNPASELKIHHQAIKGFKNAQGEVHPMRAMTMAFPPGPEVSLQEFAVGDVVEFVFRMQWEPTHEMSADSIKKLPADTELVFE